MSGRRIPPFSLASSHARPQQVEFDKKIATIIEAGFLPSQAQEALNAHGGSLTLAMNYLFEHPQAVNDQLNGPFLEYLWKRLLKNSKTCDAELLIGKNAVPVKVHKAILAISSIYFEKLFFPNENESEVASSYSFDDEPVESFQKMVEFCYLGEIEVLELEQVLSLYDLADRYSIEEMKEYLELMAKKLVNQDNVVNFIKIAEELNYEKLRKIGVDYFLAHPESVMLKKDALNALSKNQAIGLLKVGLLVREIDILERVIDYIDAHANKGKSIKEKRKDMKDLLDVIRLERLGPKGIRLALKSKLFKKQKLLKTVIRTMEK